MPSLKRFEINNNGEASWLSEKIGPTQSQLQAFLTKHRQKLAELEISVDHGTKQPSVNFATIGTLPKLKNLLLSGVCVDELSFTISNTPALESLETSFLSCDDRNGLRFELELPYLKSFKAECVTVNGKCDFGLSLSRCPSLELVRTCKFHYLSGDNYVILPNCEELTLNHSDSTECLEVISAPKLTKLSVHSAQDLKHIHLWDIPNRISIQDVEKLLADISDTCRDIAEELDQWAQKWRNGKFKGWDAMRMRWIGFEDIDEFDFNEDSDLELSLAESLTKMFRERRNMAKARIWESFIAEMSNRPEVNRKEDLPRCKLTSTNVVLSRSSRLHLLANKRLNLAGMTAESGSNFDSNSDADMNMDSDSDSDMDGVFW